MRTQAGAQVTIQICWQSFAETWIVWQVEGEALGFAFGVVLFFLIIIKT
jgi:hypothetical protein